MNIEGTIGINLEKYRLELEQGVFFEEVGKVTHVRGQMIEGYLPGASIGSVCEITPIGKSQSFKGEVVGFQDRRVLIMPFYDIHGLGHGSKIVLLAQQSRISVGPELKGRVLDALLRPLDGLGDLACKESRHLYKDVINPFHRPPIEEPLDLGVRAMNSFLTVGKGQRIGIMAGSGVGKSVLMGMIARNTKADINVIALIGERGRELREFIEKDLGPEGVARSVIIVATSDQTPLMRMKGAFTATAVAEYFASLGLDVLLMMDSVTRFSMAQREIGLSSGEPPTTKGYTPSVFAMLPKLLERAGRFPTGSITGLYTVLVEGDDMDDPIGDSVRSIVDGHIVLNRKLAQRGHFPAIDILQSTSRVMRSVTTTEHQQAVNSLRDLYATYQESEDLINIGAYKKGTSAKIDRSIDMHEPLNEFLKQNVEDKTTFEETVHLVQSLAGGV